jgi:hypothetical protein
MTEPDEPVATGDRRDEAHYEPKPDQILKARFTEKPAAPLPPDEQTGRTDAGLAAEVGAPVEDVAVTPPAPSVWDARQTD